MILHAGCVTRRIGGRWRGVLLVGRSGAGKSDLALRLIGKGWTLIADDRAVVWPAADRLYARAPAPLLGLIEARCLGVIPTAGRAFAAVDIVVDCLVPASELERVPERAHETVAGVALERVSVRALEASAPEKVEAALARTLEVRSGFPRPKRRF